MTDCIASVSILPTASKESVNIEDLVDDFVIFYVAGDGKYYMAYCAHCIYIFFSGQETTAILLSTTMVLIHQHPDVLCRYIHMQPVHT